MKLRVVFFKDQHNWQLLARLRKKERICKYIKSERGDITTDTT